MTPADLAALLRHARAQAGLTQAELAAAARIEPRTVSEWERGQSLDRIARFFAAVEAAGLAVLVRRERPGPRIAPE